MPVDGREVLRCDHCRLVQFATLGGCCRRCHRPYVAPIVVEPITKVVRRRVPQPHCYDIGFAVRVVRAARGLSQRQLAARLDTPRTYVSKVECGCAVPTLESIQRLARALGLTPGELVQIAVIGANLDAIEPSDASSLPIIPPLATMAAAAGASA
jgi:DNA-binding XRE family transcriptional regulator